MQSEHLKNPQERNDSYKIYGGLSFYQRKEIKDLLAYYRLTINPSDEEAFKRIIITHEEALEQLQFKT